MNGPTRPRLHSRDWFGKASAGAVLGLAIALLITSIFTLLVVPTDPEAMSGKAQFAMWMVAPVWAAILSFVFLFQNGRRAWLSLGMVTLALYAVLQCVHRFLT